MGIPKNSRNLRIVISKGRVPIRFGLGIGPIEERGAEKPQAAAEMDILKKQYRDEGCPISFCGDFILSFFLQ